MEYSITIDNVDFGNPYGLVIKQELNQVHLVDFEVFDLTTAQESVCIKNKDVVVMFGSSVAFTGKTRNVSTLSDGDTKKVECQCGSVILSDRINYDSAETDGRKEWNNTTGKSIVQTLVSGVMGEGVIDTMDTIGFRAEYDTMLGAVSGVAKICGKNWYVDREADDGAITSVTETTITDTTKTWVVDSLAGELLMVLDESDVIHSYTITSNTATVITCTGETFVTDGIKISDVFIVLLDYRINVTTQGSATSTQTFILGTDVIEDEPKDALDDIFNVIHVLGYGDGINQLRGQGFHATLVRTYLDADITDSSTSVTVNDASSFATSDIVWIGRERCTITSIATNTITVTRNTTGGINAYPHKSGIEVVLAKRGATEYDIDNPATLTSIDTNGIKENRFTDRSIIDQNTIDFLTQRLLEKYKDEAIVGSMEYINEHATSVLGDIITITDYDSSNIDYRLSAMEYSDDYGSVLIKYKSVGSFDGELVELDKDMDINNPYGQGATNIFQVQSYENCDGSHPLNVKFRLPDDVIAINKVLLSFKIEDYRAYHKANADESTHTHNLNVWNHNNAYDCGILGTQDIAGEHRMVVHTGGVAPSATAAGSAHTHGVTYGIEEQALSSPSVNVKAGVDGSETVVNTYTSNQEDLDIASHVNFIGNWINIEFTPNQNMRIEANIYIKCFVKSK